MAVDSTEVTPTPAPEGVSAYKGRHYVLAILFLVYSFSFIDRQILVILQESIKADLGLSDTQLGVLSGFSFAIFYVTAGIPIANWADRANRKNIVAGALTIWSGMTALSGMVGNYAQLVAARIGVGVGEAGCSPPAHSMISDMYPEKSRATALSVYSAGIYIGVFAGYLLGGTVEEILGWRMTFMIVGLPGIGLAALLFFTVKEPARRVMPKAAEDKASVKESIAAIFKFKSFRYFSFACAMSGFVSYGVGNFMPSYLARSHGMSSSDIGLVLSMTSLFGGVSGTILGGYLVDKLGAKDVRWYLWVPGLTASIAVPMLMWVYQSDNTTAIVWFYVIPTLFGAMYLGPSIAVSHMLVGPQMRAMASAILFFVLNLIGLGMGPVVIGFLSDILQETYGTAGLRHAMTLGSTIVILKAYFFWKGGQALPGDLKRAQAEQKAAEE